MVLLVQGKDGSWLCNISLLMTLLSVVGFDSSRNPVIKYDFDFIVSHATPSTPLLTVIKSL